MSILNPIFVETSNGCGTKAATSGFGPHFSHFYSFHVIWFLLGNENAFVVFSADVEVLFGFSKAHIVWTYK